MTKLGMKQENLQGGGKEKIQNPHMNDGDNRQKKTLYVLARKSSNVMNILHMQVNISLFQKAGTGNVWEM